MSLPHLMIVLICALAACGKTNTPHSNPPPPQAASPSDTARTALLQFITRVKGADMRLYNAKDDKGHSMDCIKIIENPYQPGQFIGVYHYLNNSDNRFKANLAISTDLRTWQWIRELGGSGENGPCHQPTIYATVNKEFVLAWEEGPTSTPKNHIRVSFYKNWEDLKNGNLLRDYETPNTLSACAEGTPNIYSATLSSCDIGMHYYRNCDVDRQARAKLVFENGTFSWSAEPQPKIDNAIQYWDVYGNIGDRDGMIRFGNYDFDIIEGQLNKNDWSAWRTFIYDFQTGKAHRANITTDNGSSSFGNPTVTLTRINGKNALLVTLFVFSQGAAPGEAGELIYYNYY